MPDKMHVMDQDTKNISLTIAQPITQLYTLYNVYKINSLNESATLLEIETQRRDIRHKVADAYFNILKLEKTKENLLSSIKLVQSYKEITENFYKNGMVQKDDVMRVDVKLSAIKDALSEVESGIAVMKSSLNTMIGKDPSDEIELVSELSETPSPPEISLEDSIKRAIENRKEIKSLKLRTDMLYAKRNTTIGSIIPSLTGLFTYTRQWGNSFQPEASWFVGGQISWTFWEWGSSYFQLKANSREIEKAKLGLSVIKDGIVIDVKNAYFKVKNSFSSLLSNRKSIELAMEVYRIAVKKYENAQIAATEVLDAETMLITIYSNLTKEKALGEAVDEINKLLNNKLPSGYSYRFTGQADFMKENFQSLFISLLLGVIMIYFILASQFESFVHPLTIMFSLPFSLIGAIGLLLITGYNLSMTTMIGFIMLMGLVTKNAILLVDFALRNREAGLSLNESIIKAGTIRLRPILMTTFAMIFGMLPIALRTSLGAEIRAPMAIAVIGGLVTSTILTLVIVPVIFSYFQVFVEKFRSQKTDG